MDKGNESWKGFRSGIILIKLEKPLSLVVCSQSDENNDMQKVTANQPKRDKSLNEFSDYGNFQFSNFWSLKAKVNWV